MNPLAGIGGSMVSIAAQSRPSQAPNNPSYSGVFHEAFDNLQRIQNDAASSVRGLLSGDGTDIHTALIATQKAGLAFDAALAVRNKAMGAYQQIMSMQF